MSYLLDTNVVSELARTSPDRNVAKWIQVVPTQAMHFSVLSMGEIRKGVDRLEESARKEKLRIWLEQELPVWFENRLLPVSLPIADRWGRLLATLDRRPPVIDGLFAATALVHGLTIVTRNEKDFALPGLRIVNPWRP